MSELKSEFLECATSIGLRLCNEAIWDGSRCNWLGFSTEEDKTAPGGYVTAFRSFEPEVYRGTSGIALFLSQLYQITKEETFKKTAVGAIQQAFSRLTDIPTENSLGLFVGKIGIAYASSRIGRVINHPGFLKKSEDIIVQTSKTFSFDHKIDVIFGNAGAIPALISMYLFHQKEVFIDIANKLAKELLECAKKENIGWSWSSLKSESNKDKTNLTGFSHGVGGIAWGLLELYQQTKNDKYRYAAEQAFKYENHWYNAKEENWADLRNIETGNSQKPEDLSYAVVWCHGAAGIGLSRLRAYQILGDNQYMEEAKAAIRTTIRMFDDQRNSQVNYSLCHGLSGNSELLIIGSQVLNDPLLKENADKIGEQGIENYHKKNFPWPCGIPEGETPGLMLGLAGIGHFYLRLYDPLNIPPIVIIFPEKD